MEYKCLRLSMHVLTNGRRFHMLCSMRDRCVGIQHAVASEEGIALWRVS